MFKLYTALLLTTIAFEGFAQREDNMWAFCYRFSSDTISNRIFFKFNDSLEIIKTQRPISLDGTNASICDSSGQLLIYSNGCYIETYDGKIIKNSQGLNPGLLYDLSCANKRGYRLESGMVLLKKPGDNGIFHFFHLPSVDPLYLINVLHTVVDMSANNGNGTTMIKNQVIVSDTIHYHGLHAVRHANGRDWWIIAAKKFSNRYYIISLSPSGIETKYQEIGIADTGVVYGGQMVFAPDGSKLARFDSQDDLRIFDFDRCTGTLSNPIHLPMQNTADIEILAGLAWSADSRYLYAAENRRLLQFDSYATDLASSMQVVAEADPPVCFLSGSIGNMELGPDGMIYCRPYNGQKCLHRMKHPERAGTACTFEQNYFQLEYPFNGLPHFPNFRLGPVDGSPCDTLGIDNHPLAGWRYDKTGGLGVDFTSVSWYEPVQWQWDFGDPGSGANNFSAEKHPSHTFSAPGGYEVCLTVSNQYGSDTKCKMVWVETVGSGEAGAGGNIVVFSPNPTGGPLRWSGLPEGAVVTVRVFDALGRLRLERETAAGGIDLVELENGVFYTALTSGQGDVLATRVIIVKK